MSNSKDSISDSARRPLRCLLRCLLRAAAISGRPSCSSLDSAALEALRPLRRLRPACPSLRSSRRRCATAPTRQVRRARLGRGKTGSWRSSRCSPLLRWCRRCLLGTADWSHSRVCKCCSDCSWSKGPPPVDREKNRSSTKKALLKFTQEMRPMHSATAH